jgi:hypothetical protein
MFGRTIRIVTTQNTYLSITGFEAYTGAGGSSSTSTRRVISSSSNKKIIAPRMKTGGNGFGFGGSYNIPANTKVTFNTGSAKQSTNYNKQNSYPASNAWSNGSRFTHT